MTPPSCIKTEAAIIGAGAAGVTMALELARAGISSVLIPGAGWREGDRDRKLYEVVIDPPGSHEPLDSARVRQIGGSTALWGGRCVPYDASDFAPHPAGLRPGWPISYEEVAAYYPAACRWCDCGEPDFTSAEPILPGLSDRYITGWNQERWSPPVDFGRRYRRDIQTSGRIQLLEGFSATEFSAGENEFVQAVEVRNLADERISIQASCFILAAGGLETNRLLLHARQGSLGNRIASETLGQYFMGHTNGVAAEMQLSAPEKLVYRFRRDAAGVYIRPRLSVSPEAQAEAGILNIVGLLERGSLTREEQPVEQATVIAHEAFRLARTGQFGRLAREFPRLSAAALSAVGQDPLEILKTATARFAPGRRLPTVLPRQNNPFGITFQGEELPIAESRIELDQEKDEMGIPRLRLLYRLHPLSFQTAITFHRLLDEALKRQGFGCIKTPPEEVERRVMEAPRKTMAHHLGGARMGSSARDGVVDANLLVRGTGNLYVASSAVFPTGSHANPTLTLIALTCRLGRHLIDSQTFR